MKKYNFKFNKKYIIASSVLLLTCSAACTKLDEDIFSEISTEKTEFTEDDIRSLVAPVHASLRSLYWGWDGLFDIYEESSDLIMTPFRIGTGWGDYYISMHKHTFNPSISHFYGLWYNAYRGIGSANQVLDLESEAVTSYIPEMRAMRALFYYFLLDNFRNIPLETTQKLPGGYLPPQVDPQEVFDFIVSELEAVKDDLGDGTTNFGHMNRYAANMVLAKLYLNHNAWFNTTDNSYYEKALAEVNEVINSGKYSLSANYEDPFKSEISSNPEVIFGIPFDFTYASGNYLSNKALHGGSAATFGLSGAPWNGSCAIPQFIDTYDEDDERLAKTWLVGQQYSQSGSLIYVGAEPLVYTKDVSSIDNPGAYQFEGARFRKYEIVAGNVGTYGDDVPLFRLTDAYFIKAECLLRLETDEQTAADLVTEVRKRAFTANPDKAVRTIAQLKGGSVYNYGHYENGVWETVEGGSDVVLGGLLDDLAWEFVGEHHRRQDLIRFHLSNGNNVYLGKSWFCKDAEGNNASHKNIFPIPKNFMDSNVSFVQNPGY
ncbi:RagB/SusD family nutrient uptake outer membrane protein [Sphingobacterium sp. LRF_L2]|uniref:RagB/SusD family nutrient uptake outer membrane protein n=1 Tax=Sphingobacterium sp. LRF_L2 TaxID=3369421 RepID=UPI003F6213EF